MKFIKSIKFRLLIGLTVLSVVLIVSFLKIYFKLNEIKEEEIIKNSFNLNLKDSFQDIQYLTIFSLIIFISIGAIIVILISNSVLVPIVTLTKHINDLGEGKLAKIQELAKWGDEIDAMRESLRKVNMGIKTTSDFAYKIGKGELDSEFSPLSDEDLLGHSLLTMRENLIINSNIDKDRNEIIAFKIEIGNILRVQNNLEQIGDELLRFITKKINSLQGAFYVINSETLENPTIKLTSLLAFDKKKKINKVFKLGEGLVGQSVIEQETIHLTEIPKNYFSLSSGLINDQKPTSILIIPLIFNEKVFGVLEFASIYKYSDFEIELVSNITKIIAQTIYSFQVNERTEILLEEAQKMGEELAEQTVVLQQNAEEMLATQEELYRTNIQLIDQIEEVNNSQKRTSVLLENASEVICIVDHSGTVTYVSPSVKNILGYDVEEIIGSKEIDRIVVENKEAYNKMFSSLLSLPNSFETTVYRYIQKNGEVIWLEILGKNMLNDPSINGVVINMHDITERLTAEKEASMRSQMQSLSENSPDLIVRLNTTGKIYYINPVIEKLTHLRPSSFNQKSIYNSELSEGVVWAWDKILKETVESRKNSQLEMPFPSKDGLVIMNVNAIPEFNEYNELKSVLLVSNDITDRKKIEVEVQNKNKKITESINYAQRIQEAILPDQKRIFAMLPEYFMYYKPKDVVSGDFPWFLETENDIFVAAVDCTGHGVPGAMLSLIGYFLLNDIVKSQKVTEPGKILDLLDESVTRTLRQDVEGNQMRDGMDIALCKINKKLNQIEYAGAHRPLFQLRKSEVLEYKGNKFAIGGGKFSNQTLFTNHLIDIQKGDSFYFCSDGFTDQFGEKEVKKIGSARLRNLILSCENTKNFSKLEKKFSDYFEEWKGSQKQLDDLLLIGIRF